MKNPLTTRKTGKPTCRSALFVLLAGSWAASSFLLVPALGQAQEGAIQTQAPKESKDKGKEKDKPRIETEIIALTPAGAVPATIVRKAEPFFLLLLTQAKQTPFDVSLVPVAALPDPLKLQGIINQHSLEKKRRSAGLIDLPPGEYHLQTSDSQILCTITLQ